MVIRKAKLKDIEQITDCAVNLLRYHHKLDPYFAPAKNVTEMYQGFFKRCIYAKNKCLLVAEENGKVIGYALGELNSRPPIFEIRRVGFISDIFIEEQFRNLGIAEQFLLRLEEWFRENELEYIELTVHVKNEIGKKAWAKYGFETYMVKQRIKIEKLNLHNRRL